MERKPINGDVNFVGGECALCEELLEHKLSGEHVFQFVCGHVAHEACFYQHLGDENPEMHCPTCDQPLALSAAARGGSIHDLGKLRSMVQRVMHESTDLRPRPAHGNPAARPEKPSKSVLEPWDLHETTKWQRGGADRSPSSNQGDTFKNVSTVQYARSSVALGAESIAADTFKDSGYDSHGRSTQELPGKAIEADSMTIATDNQSLNMPEATKEQLVTALVEELLDSIATEEDRQTLTATQIEDACGLLKECSIEMGLYASNKLERDTVTFIRHQRRRIVRSLEKYWNRLDEEVESDTEVNNGVMSVNEKMRWWRTDEEADAEDTAPEPLTANFSELEEEPLIPELPHARAYLTTHPFYPRLIFRLKSILEDKICDGYRSRDVRQTILRELAAPQPRSTPPRTTQFFFPAPSRPFLAYNALFRDGHSLSDAVVVSGGLDNAFTTTCVEYVRMIWGRDGVAVLGKVQEALDSEIRASWILLGDPGRETHISFEVVDEHEGHSNQEYLLVLVTGNPLAIADLGEQLVWLSSSFLELDESEGLMVRRPNVKVETSDKRWNITFHVDSQDARISNRLSSSPKPRCWHDLLQGFNLVEGFPIRPRKTTQKGLEIPLDMMAFLAETPRATSFDSRMVLKGWATTLIPTVRLEDSLLWHYMQQPNGNHLSYAMITDSFAQTGKDVASLGWSCLNQDRHFLGWCDASQVLAGTSSTRYDRIDWAQADFCSAGIAFEKISIMGGQFLTGGATFTKGNRDTPLFPPAPRHYREQVEWLSGKNVVFYDADERRAWLIDGALAMFHIMCTRLCQRPYRSGPESKLEKLRYAKSGDGSDAGYNALTDAANMQLEVFREEQTWEEKVESFISPSIVEKRTKVTVTRFSDLVTQAWYVVEEMFAHQARLQTASSVNMRFTTRDRLEGYDFMDVAKGEFPLKPRFVTLNRSGRGWVDFVRSIGAVSMLGSGFGDLIIPADRGRGLCQSWQRLPHGRDYLATTVSTIKQIRRRNATRQAGRTFQLAQGVYWHQHDKLFGACHCRSHRWKDSCDRVQTLLPESIGTKRPPEDFSNPKHESGAVIFGRGKRCPYHWPKDPEKDPEERLSVEGSDAGDEEEELASNINTIADDSGIGTSLSNGASHSLNSASASFSASTSAPLSAPTPSNLPLRPSGESMQKSPIHDIQGPDTTACPANPASSEPEQDLNDAAAIPNPGPLTLPEVTVTQTGSAIATEPDHHVDAEELGLRTSRSRLILRAKTFTKKKWHGLTSQP